MLRPTSTAHISRCPPPMVSTWPPAVTSMRAPGSRGPEPSTIATVTSTAGSAITVVSHSFISISSGCHLHGSHGAQDLLAGRRSVQRRIDAVSADSGNRIADREENRERQQQRRLADGLGTVDAVLDIAVVEQPHAEVLRAVGHAGDLVRRRRMRHQLAGRVPPQLLGGQPAHALYE